VVVLFHGGFWKPMYKSDLMDDLARDMAGRGLAVWNVEYRRVGVEGGGGGWPTTYKDAAAALSTLGDLPGVDAERVITFGHSAGGHMALWVAMDASRRSRLGIGDVRAPLGAISLAGVLDLVTAANRKLGARAVQALMGGEPSDLEVEYREASLAAALPHGVRQLIIHGTSDGVVPPDISESYAARACFEGDTVDLRLVAGEDHMQVIDPTSSAWRCATQYIEEIFGLGTDAGVRPERA
jgi:acetyl esterase/lipase